MDRTPQIQLLEEMFACGLRAVSAEVCLKAHLPEPVAGTTLILAVGKAAAAMAKEACAQFAERAEVIVLTRYGHTLPVDQFPEGTQIFEAGHPLPDDHGIEATEKIIERVQRLGADDQLLMLVSGGTSAVLVSPADGISLRDKQNVTRALLSSGASISEINCVRSHLSKIKGGRLALMARPARVVTLAISDIPGDDPALIGSGPTVADASKLDDARRILEHYGIEPDPGVAAALADPANETPFATAQALMQTRTKVVARSQMALAAVGALAHAAGYTPVYLGDDIEGDSTELGVVHAALALHHAAKGGKYALISGGETTVIVRNPMGKGGRNTEYLLSLAISLDGHERICGLACDTDGIDGTEDNAGAIITPTTLERAGKEGLSALQALNSNRAHGFFEKLGDLVVTGPTLTNVNDLRILLVDGDEAA